LLDKVQTNAAGGTPQSIKTRVFLSYSRQDSGFTDRLAEALTDRDYTPDYDRAGYDPANIDSGISAQDPWWQRLQQMIAKADAIVFIVSPGSTGSAVCDEEIAYAQGLGKRIIPILRRPIDFAKAPPRISALNVKLDFTDDREEMFSAALDQLCTALDLDVVWYRESRRLTQLALEWDWEGRPADRLMSSADMKATARLLESRPRNAELPPQVLIDFRDESREHRENEVRRLRRMQTASTVLMICVIAGLIGWINQSFLISQWNWYVKMRPYMKAQVRPFVLTPEAERALKPAASFHECSKNCPEMIVVPAGSFMMGSPETENGHDPRESPLHKVTIPQPFSVSKFPITFDEWDACVSVGGCVYNSDGSYGRGTRPVNNVSWDEAEQYAAWFSLMTGRPYRLLSEAEFEYAARAGTTTAYPWGDELGKGNANCKGCGSEWDSKSTSPAGFFKPNAFGLFDMQGNVFEWVEDCYEESHAGAPADGSARISASCKRHVVRGGSWYDSPDYLRSANRSRQDAADSRDDDLGFRIARTLAP
jgi:formylglycine-generating enzyme required for sulfatase activity